MRHKIKIPDIRNERSTDVSLYKITYTKREGDGFKFAIYQARLAFHRPRRFQILSLLTASPGGEMGTEIIKF